MPRFQAIDEELDSLMVELSQRLKITVAAEFGEVMKQRLDPSSQWQLQQRSCSFGDEGLIFIITTIQRKAKVN